MDVSNYLAAAEVNYIFRGGAAFNPAHLWIALLTTNCVPSDTGTTIQTGGPTGVEVSGGSYARQQLDPSTSNWAAYVTGTQQTSNTPIITFPTATANWGTVVGVAIVDASSGGNILFFGALTTSITVNTGGIFQFAAAALVVEVDN
jgi:hypothetical protein